MFNRKLDDALPGLSEELESLKRNHSVTKDTAANILSSFCPDVPNSSQAYFYRFKESFHAGSVMAAGYAEHNDFFGGDFFVCRDVAPQRVCAALIEPSGRSPQAALIGAMLLGSVEEWMAEASFTDPSSSMQISTRRLNQSIASRPLHGKFACVTLVVLDTDSG